MKALILNCTRLAGIRQQILDTEILVIATLTWLARRSASPS